MLRKEDLQAGDGGAQESLETVMAELSYQDHMSRTIFHRCCLDQNPRILSLLFSKINRTAKTPEEQKKAKEAISKCLSSVDKYNNSPLALACIYSNPQKKDDKEEIVRLLLDYDADPNIPNKFTKFTPLHWAARHGEKKIIKMLCANKAQEFLPERKGCFPVDYAGLFRHKSAV